MNGSLSIVWKKLITYAICQEFLNNQTENGYITFINKIQNLPEIALLKNTIVDLKEQKSHRNMQIKELKETIKLYQKDSIADVLFCVVCNQDTIHNPDCAVCGSKL